MLEYLKQRWDYLKNTRSPEVFIVALSCFEYGLKLKKNTTRIDTHTTEQCCWEERLINYIIKRP
jgi:hypothetical protein